MLERYVIPLAPYALVALLALAGLVVFFFLERDLRRLKSLLGKQSRGQLVSREELQTRLENLSVRLREAEERASIPVQATLIKPSLNLNKRNQVIRMSRRGQPAANIAASLSMPRKEVELLLKIHNLTLNNAAEKAS